MTLGERIAYYRGKLGLSQGELAEQLGVSRQAVSKWETDAGLPDLERLIALSRLYHITLDELVKGESPEETAEAPEEIPVDAVIAKPAAPSGQKTIGYILLGVGLLCAVLALFLNWALLIPAGYLLICAVLCLTLRRYAGRIIIGGTLLAILLPAQRWFGGVSLGSVINPVVYQSEFYGIGVWVTWGLWAVLVLYVVLALRRTRWQKYTPLALGWTVVLGLHGWLAPLWQVLGGAEAASWYYPVVSGLINLLAAAVVLLTVRSIWPDGRKRAHKLKRAVPKRSGSLAYFRVELLLRTPALYRNSTSQPVKSTKPPSRLEARYRISTSVTEE